MESKKKNIMNRSYLVAFGLMLFLFANRQAVHIQFAEGDKYREIAQKETLRKTFSSRVGGIFF